jgi:DNA-binding IclR family transcriptional regulator
VQAVRKSAKGETRDKLLRGLEQGDRDYRKFGFCLSLGDWERHVHAVGVPMGTMALSCFGPPHEMTRARLVSEVGPRLVALRDKLAA